MPAIKEKLQVNLSACFSSSIEPYKYTSLPSIFSLRLLKITTTFWGRVKYSLHTLELNGETPAFDVITHSRCYVDPRSHSIRCGNHYLPVCADAKHALESLRTVDFVTLRKKVRYVWMESVCIDPENPVERTYRVWVMANILCCAQKVVVWLGEKDFTTKDASKALNILSAVPQEEWECLISLSWYSQTRFFERIGLEPISLRRRLALIAFFDQSWFHEIWSLQEVAFGTGIILACGKTRIPWFVVSKSLSFLTHVEWEEELDTKEIFVGNFSAQNKVGHLSKKHKKLLKSGISLNAAIIHLDSAREVMLSNEGLPLFHSLLQSYRGCKVADKRDIIHGLIAMSRKDGLPFSKYPGGIVPSYGTSALELYTTVTRLLFACYGFRILSDVQDIAASVPSLPSWVPDYSMPMIGPVPLSERGGNSWNASGSKCWEQQFADIETLSLKLQGLKIDVVSDKVKRLNQMLYAAEFWKGICEVTDHLDPVYVFPLDGRYQSCKEAVWRTVLADTYAGEHPAPPECEKILSEFLSSDADHTRAPMEQMRQEIEHANDRRSLFRTSVGSLGIGPQSLQILDEVWILNGATVPFVLRPREDGNYQLIGEVYLHGLMHGELTSWRTDKIIYEDACLT
ncbi:heterokaryon incompatibility protein [Rutstroemia sp. NJR-2017a BVV2]|nr:heterokaryon incompatibility protein [Rutstroemia sp. NJR-2017a BVV2]